jgi:hypothetical protein
MPPASGRRRGAPCPVLPTPRRACIVSGSPPSGRLIYRGVGGGGVPCGKPWMANHIANYMQIHMVRVMVSVVANHMVDRMAVRTGEGRPDRTGGGMAMGAAGGGWIG